MMVTIFLSCALFVPASGAPRLKIFKADPGEAAAMIQAHDFGNTSSTKNWLYGLAQVIMDIAGVVLTCSLGALILETF